MLELWISIISITDLWIALIEEWISIKGLTLLPFHGGSTFLRFGGLSVLGPISSDDFHSMMTSSNGNIFRHRLIPLTKASDTELWFFLWSATEQTFKQNNLDAGDLRRHRAHYDITVMDISSVIKISFCRISFSGHRNKFCPCPDSIYRSRVSYLSYAKMVATGWHKLAPAKFESEQNELLKEFKFWWNDR